MADDVLYRTESEIQYLKSKLDAMNKFNESVDFYHEVVPREEVVKEEVPAQQDIVPTQQETGNNNPSDPVTIDENKS